MEARQTDFEHRCDLWVLIRPSKDVSGQWVAHCLNLDLISQGSSPEHARDMIREAAASTLAYDLKAGRNPLEHRSASQELWEELRFVMTKGRPVTFSEVSRDHGTLAVMVGFQISDSEARESEPPELLPAWFLSSR